jgi:hypothetical protein
VSAEPRSEAAKVVPWFIARFRGPGFVGPFFTDSAGYVFGDERPLFGAGIDVSAAVKDYLGLGSLGLVDWRFVQQTEVPPGPWSNVYSRRVAETSAEGGG